MINALIFDMDGLMISSGHIWKLANQKLMSKFNKNHDEDFSRQFSGLKSHDVSTLIKDHYQLSVSIDYISETRNNIMLELSKKPVKTMDGFKKLISLLSKSGYKKAVATSTYKNLAHQLLRSAKVYDHFEIIVTGEEVIRGKPAPDIFLLAAKRLQIDPKYCLVLEDAIAGIDAAHAAGMKSIAISKLDSKETFKNADYFFQSLSEIDISFLQSL